MTRGFPSMTALLGLKPPIARFGITGIRWVNRSIGQVGASAFASMMFMRDRCRGGRRLLWLPNHGRSVRF